jgi:hypothetical protein
VERPRKRAEVLVDAGFVYSEKRSFEYTATMMKSSTALIVSSTPTVSSTCQSLPRNASSGKNRFCPSCM